MLKILAYTIMWGFADPVIYYDWFILSCMMLQSKEWQVLATNIECLLNALNVLSCMMLQSKEWQVLATNIECLLNALNVL